MEVTVCIKPEVSTETKTLQEHLNDLLNPEYHDQMIASAGILASGDPQFHSLKELIKQNDMPQIEIPDITQLLRPPMAFEDIGSRTTGRVSGQTYLTQRAETIPTVGRDVHLAISAAKQQMRNQYCKR